MGISSTVKCEFEQQIQALCVILHKPKEIFNQIMLTQDKLNPQQIGCDARVPGDTTIFTILWVTPQSIVGGCYRKTEVDALVFSRKNMQENHLIPSLHDQRLNKKRGDIELGRKILSPKDSLHPPETLVHGMNRDVWDHSLHGCQHSFWVDFNIV